jgi:glutamyl-tRNA reductase
MQRFVPEVVSIADACLGGLRGRSALLIGPEEQRQPYKSLLQQAGMKYIYQEETHSHVSAILPLVQLLMNLPASSSPLYSVPLLTASAIAQGCIGRRTPLLIFDLAESPSIEELAGLLPAVCLYTPDDLRNILSTVPSKLGVIGE